MIYVNAYVVPAVTQDLAISFQKLVKYHETN